MPKVFRKIRMPRLIMFIISYICFSFACMRLAHGARLAEVEQLYEDLFYSYNKIGRPNRNSTEKITIHFSSFLLQLIDVDEKSQVLTLSLWLEMKWYDARLVWSPTAYGGLKKLNIPSDQIWIPDIILYNNALGDPQITAVTDAKVYFDGQILWSVPSIYKAFCQIDVTYFPYDEQNCKLKFGGWTYTGDVLDMQPVPFNNQSFFNYTDQVDGLRGDLLMTGMDLSYFQGSAEWDLLNLTSVRSERIYSGCCGQSYYIDITYYINLRRKPLFYTVNLVVPCMLIAFLTTFVFYLTDHKITFAISILVALSVFWLVLIDLIPPNSEVIPLFGQYLMFTMALVVMSIFATVVILNIHHRNSHTNEMPRWIRIVFLNYLPQMLHMKVPEWHKVDPKLEEIKKVIRKSISHNDRFCGEFTRRPSPYFMMVSDRDRETRLKDLALMRGMHPIVIREMIGNISYIADHFATMEDDAKGSDDWSYVAFVIDRVFLILFTLINIVGTIVIVTKAPYFTDYREPLFAQAPIKPLGGDTLAKLYT